MLRRWEGRFGEGEIRLRKERMEDVEREKANRKQKKKIQFLDVCSWMFCSCREMLDWWRVGALHTAFHYLPIKEQ